MRPRLPQLIIILIALGAGGWLALRALRSRAAPVAVPESAFVEQRTFAATVSAVGTVTPQIGAEVRVGSQLSGRVRRLGANIGDQVERGAVIAELENEEHDALVAERQAEISVLESERGAAVARLQLARSELERIEQLERRGAATRAEVDIARERLAAAEAQESAGGSAMDRARAALRHAQIQRSFTAITAPISGVVASVATQEGETVAAGLNAPTFLTIVDLSRLQVNAFVDEVDIGKVRVGQRASFTVDAYPARDFGGSVAAIYPSATIQDNVVKYVAAVVIHDHDGLLRPSMTANVRIELEAREVLAVPVRAVRRVDGQSVIFTGDPLRPAQRPVRVGWRDGGWIEIVEGAAAGERVYIDVSTTSSGGQQ